MTHAPRDTPLSDTDRARLDALLDTLRDGELDPQGEADLHRLVTSCDQAAALYTQHMQLVASLRFRFDAIKTTAPHANTKPAPHTDAKPAPGEASGTSPYPIYRKGYEPKPSRIRPAHYAIAATLLAACGVAIYAYFSSLPHSEIPDPTSLPRVATLIQNTGNLTTPHGYPAEGDDYSSGEYTLSSGSAEFMLTNSVNVKLRGDTRMLMHNDMNVALTRGSAAFVVPSDAKGFSVHLPDRSKIVDLGTAFRVAIDDDGNATLRVTNGLVSWTPAGAEAVSIRVGQSARIVDGRVVIDDPVRFVESFESDPIPASNPKLPAVPERWVASSQLAGFGWQQHGRVATSDGAFTTPFGEHGYSIAYVNAALTTAPDTIDAPLAAGLTYTASFHVAHAESKTGEAEYLVELVAFDETDDRHDDNSGTVLTVAKDTVTSNDMSTVDRIVFTPADDHPNLGDAIGLRLKGTSGQTIVYDNIELTAAPAELIESNESTQSPSESADRSEEPRNTDGPCSDNGNSHYGDSDHETFQSHRD